VALPTQDRLPETRPAAKENPAATASMLRSQGSPFRLPERAVVFLMHQGYFFVFFVADGATEDPPVFACQEGDPGPSRHAESFSAWLEL
jgi:hypothetical protein